MNDNGTTNVSILKMQVDEGSWKRAICP